MDSIITLEGHFDSEVTLNKEGKYVVIVKSSLEDKENLESIFFVEMIKKQWDNIKNKDGKLVITGKMIVKKNKKDIPFVYVISLNVSETKEIKKKDENIETPVSCVEEKKEDDAVDKGDLKKEVKINKQIISWFRGNTEIRVKTGNIMGLFYIISLKLVIKPFIKSISNFLQPLSNI